MSKLNSLINELCPDGVEYKPLGEVCEILRGKRLTKSQLNDSGKYPVLHGGLSPMGYYDQYNRKAGTTIVVNTGNAGCVYWSDKEFWSSDACFSLYPQEILLDKFLYFFVSKSENILKSKIRYGAMPTIDANAVAFLKIPVPPIEVQREIVRILDKYSETVTALQHELEKELELRKKQYAYYRDYLLDFGDDVEWRTLGEIATGFYRGSGIKRDELTENGTPCIRYGEIYTTYGIHFDKCVSYTDENNIKSKKYMEYGDILFAITGESVEDIAKSTVYIGKEKCLVGGDIVVMKHKQNPKYLSYALSTTNARIQKSKGKIKSKVVHASLESIKQIKIPVPTIEEQERIVNILDRFDTLCNDLTSGIPAEIEARKKQYEYYRNKLLQFKIKNA